MDDCIIVVPCYNEARRLDTGAFQQFVARGHLARFLLVNDGSTDDTAAALETLRRWNPGKFDVCHLPRNVGKAEAVRQGVLRALQRPVDSVGFWDADLATPLEAIPQFCELLRRDPRLQMVIGARVKLLGRTIERRILRHYLGRLFATAASVVLRLPVYDTQCGAKLIRASAEMRALFDEPFRTNWIFDVELLARFIGGRKAGRR
ncbi:MAG: glycosyltransferase, partial [Planctomycetota bacterium]